MVSEGVLMRLSGARMPLTRIRSAGSAWPIGTPPIVRLLRMLLTSELPVKPGICANRLLTFVWPLRPSSAQL
ncbi:hypothetical protein BTO20_35420 [Mycobacterium dioxanotrophicus]|uniref:Uncharacterized protein n=1 Tax=Mycobacterium dioxanotrophicus TaxID=482462 RepID=A0A1Y0CDQ9_9MYCO|nr:hypothetical protein BTO20_35420 [Mycobacterium dioxanotrophicus]